MGGACAGMAKNLSIMWSKGKKLPEAKKEVELKLGYKCGTHEHTIAVREHEG